MKALYVKELKSFFNSMIGYVFSAFLIALVGVYFGLNNVTAGNPYFVTAISNALYLLLIAIPVLTMRSMAEERRNRTDQALITAPIKASGIIGGKYAAMVTVFLVPNLVFLICPLVIRNFGSWHGAVDYAGIMVFFLMGCAFIAAGLYVSCLTENQLIAAVGTFVIVLAGYLWDTLISYLPQSPESSLVGFLLIAVLVFVLVRGASGSTVSAAMVAALCVACVLVFYFSDRMSFAGLLERVLEKFSPTAPLNTVSEAAVLDLRGIIRYLSYIALFLFLSVRSIERKRRS